MMTNRTDWLKVNSHYQVLFPATPMPGPFLFHVVASRTFCHGIYLWVFEKVQRATSHWRCIGSPPFVHHVFQELVGGFVFESHILPSGKYDAVNNPVGLLHPHMFLKSPGFGSFAVATLSAVAWSTVNIACSLELHKTETKHLKGVCVRVCTRVGYLHDMLRTCCQLLWGFAQHMRARVPLLL